MLRTSLELIFWNVEEDKEFRIKNGEQVQSANRDLKLVGGKNSKKLGIRGNPMP